MKKFLTAFLCFTLLLSLLTPAGLAAEEKDGRILIYVSPDGSDEAEGTEAAPFKSLIAARDKIRALKAEGAAPEKGFVVYLREGDYQMQECLELTAEDSGTEQAPVIYRAYPSETATLVGGASIPGSAFKAVTDAAAKSRIIDEAARSKVMVADLHAMGFTDFGEPFWPGAYSYAQSWLEEPEAASPELFIDGAVQTLARYPNEGYMTIEEVIDVGAIPRNWEPDKSDYAEYVPESERDPEDTFEFVPGDSRYKLWTNVPENTALMYGYWWYDWADHTVPMRKATAGKIESGEPSWYGIRANQRFYVMNLMEEIDMPGEYYLDRENGLLYLYPPKDLAGADIKFSLLENDLIHIEGAEHITFKGLIMTAMRSSAVVISTGNNIEIRDCEIEYTADYAVYMESPARQCRVIDSYLHDVDGGMWIKSGDRPTLTAGECIVRNNKFERFSRITKTYTPAVQLSGVGDIIEHNEMSDAPHCAIQYAGNDHLIRYNEIYEVCKEADDMGPIYSGRSWTARGTKIHYNYIHDIDSDSNGSVGLFLIYFDDRLSEQEVVGNLVVNCEGQAVFSNGGRDNVCYNNIFVNVEKSYRFGAIIPPDPFATNPVNLMNSLEAVPWQNELWTERYPKLAAIFDEGKDMATYPEDSYAGNNLLINCGPKTIDTANIHPEAYKRGTFEKDYEAASVEFLDPENGIYLLPEDSVVFEELPTFQQLPVTRMGTYTERAEARVQEAVTMAVGSSKVFSHGETTAVDTENPLVVPVIEGDRTFVPLRFISEAFGMTVNFDPETSLITVSGAEGVLELTPGNSTVKKNGTEITIDAAPFITGEGRTLVPLRAVTELLGKQVHWDDRGLIIVSDIEGIINPTADDGLVDYLYSELISY